MIKEEKRKEKKERKEKIEGGREENAYPCANDVKDADVVLNDSRLPISNCPVNRITESIEISHKSHIFLFLLFAPIPFSSAFSLFFAHV